MNLIKLYKMKKYFLFIFILLAHPVFSFSQESNQLHQPTESLSIELVSETETTEETKAINEHDINIVAEDALKETIEEEVHEDTKKTIDIKEIDIVEIDIVENEVKTEDETKIEDAKDKVDEQIIQELTEEQVKDKFLFVENENKNSDLYVDTNINVIEDSLRFNNNSLVYNLSWKNLSPNAEQVIFDNKKLTKDLDYIIDYNRGIILFLKQFENNSVVKVLYSLSPKSNMSFSGDGINNLSIPIELNLITEDNINFKFVSQYDYNQNKNNQKKNTVIGLDMRASPVNNLLIKSNLKYNINSNNLFNFQNYLEYNLNSDYNISFLSDINNNYNNNTLIFNGKLIETKTLQALLKIIESNNQNKNFSQKNLFVKSNINGFLFNLDLTQITNGDKDSNLANLNFSKNINDFIKVQGNVIRKEQDYVSAQQISKINVVSNIGKNTNIAMEFNENSENKTRNNIIKIKSNLSNDLLVNVLYNVADNSANQVQTNYFDISYSLSKFLKTNLFYKQRNYEHGVGVDSYGLNTNLLFIPNAQCNFEIAQNPESNKNIVSYLNSKKFNLSYKNKNNTIMFSHFVSSEYLTFRKNKIFSIGYKTNYHNNSLLFEYNNAKATENIFSNYQRYYFAINQNKKNNFDLSFHTTLKHYTAKAYSGNNLEVGLKLNYKF